MNWSRRRALSVAGTALVAGCTGITGTSEPTDDPPETVAPPDVSFTPEADWEAPTEAPTAELEQNVLVENLEIPWDVSVASNGDLFVTERVGRVNRFSAGDVEEVLEPEDAIDAGSVPPGHDEQPWWVDGGEGGTLGVAVHPNYPDQSYIFVYYTAETPVGRVNRVSRFDVSADEPADTEEPIVDGVPANQYHNGGRLQFGPEGYLWATFGDAGEPDLAQDPTSLAGKVVRTDVYGDPAPDNPDLGEDADGRIFTYGHRNPQGLVWLPDGTPVASEHGEAAHDEVNRLVAGDDYGWPNQPREKEKYVDAEDVHPPLANTGADTWAPTGARFYTGDAVPSWRNRMLIGCLGSQQAIVLTLTPPDGDLPPAADGRRFDADWFDDTYTATAHPVLGDELGRIRHLEQGADGELYAVTSNRDGRATGEFPRERDDVLVSLQAA